MSVSLRSVTCLSQWFITLSLWLHSNYFFKNIFFLIIPTHNKQEPGFLMSYALSFMCSVSSVKIRCDCSFSWCWWNWYDHHCLTFVLKMNISTSQLSQNHVTFYHFVSSICAELLHILIFSETRRSVNTWFTQDDDNCHCMGFIVYIRQTWLFTKMGISSYILKWADTFELWQHCIVHDQMPLFTLWF